MAQVYSARFGSWHHSTGDPSFGPPAGTLWVVRQITVYNGNALTLAVTWSFGDAGTNAVYVAHLFQVGDGQPFFNWEGRIVVPDSAPVGWVSDGVLGEANVDVYIGGYQLDLP